MHPAGNRPTPSRHIPLDHPAALEVALADLWAANQQGWGAFVAVGTRRTGLGRWRRGGLADVLALPALFVDVDVPTSDTLTALRALRPTPSCLVFTGGGYHAYWWLEAPLSDMAHARVLLDDLRRAAGGDALSPAQSLRIVGTYNTKPQRHSALCELVTLHAERRYPLTAFAHFGACPTVTPTTKAATKRPCAPTGARPTLNPLLIVAVRDQLIADGYTPHGDWLRGRCLQPHRHRHHDAHPSFAFNTRSGYGHCFRCGTFLLKDVCAALGIHPADYGGLCT